MGWSLRQMVLEGELQSPVSKEQDHSTSPGDFVTEFLHTTVMHTSCMRAAGRQGRLAGALAVSQPSTSAELGIFIKPD